MEKGSQVKKHSEKFHLGGYWFYPLFLSTLVCILYLSTLSNHYTADSLTYALVVEVGEFRDMVDPTHLLIHPIGWVWHQLWLSFGWSKGSLLPLQVLNALAGAICAGLVFQIARAITRSLRIALIVATGFAVSGGTWLLSVEAEFVTVPHVTTLFVLLLLVSPPRNLEKRSLYAFFIGLAISLSILTYLINLILIPVSVFGLWLKAIRSRNIRWWSVFLFTLPIVTVAFPILLASLSYSLDGEWSRLSNQMGFVQYGQISWTNIPQGVYGFLRSLALFQNLAMNDSTAAYLRSVSFVQELIFFGYYLVIFLLAVFPILYLLTNRKYFDSQQSRSITIFVVWSALSAVFGFFWVPGDISFWFPVLIAWWMFVGLVLEHRSRKDSDTKFMAEFLAISFSLLLLVINLQMVIGPRRYLSTNQYYEISQTVVESTDKTDVIITDINSPTTIYIAYFSRRMLIPLREKGLNFSEMRDIVEQIYPNGLGIEGEVFILRDGILKNLEY
jgi:hypothetical protein